MIGARIAYKRWKQKSKIYIQRFFCYFNYY